MAEELDSLRRMPFSLEAEQSVLGAIIINPEGVEMCAGMLSPDDFYLTQHRLIYESMTELFIKSRTIDIVTLIETLKAAGTYEEAGGKAYLVQLAEMVPSVSNIREYAKIVADKARLRRLVEAAGEIADMAYAGGDEVPNILDAAEQKIYGVAQGTDVSGFVRIRDLLIGALDQIQLLQTDPDAASGTPTYYPDLDHMLVGLGDSDLVLLASRPAMGKTSFAVNIATNIAAKQNKAVAIFELEMSKEQLIQRMIASESMVENQKLRTGEITDDEWVRLAEAVARLSEMKVLVDDTPGMTVGMMKAKLRREKNLGLVVVDYLQLLQSDRRSDNRVQEVSEISRGLKLMAKELNVPIIACAQLSRGPESRTDKRPMLSDLRESGSIEQDADIVMFLYRDDYYNEQTDNKNMAECIIAKNRHGPTGKVDLLWLGQFTKYASIDQVHHE